MGWTDASDRSENHSLLPVFFFMRFCIERHLSESNVRPSREALRPSRLRQGVDFELRLRDSGGAPSSAVPACRGNTFIGMRPDGTTITTLIFRFFARSPLFFSCSPDLLFASRCFPKQCHFIRCFVSVACHCSLSHSTLPDRKVEMARVDLKIIANTFPALTTPPVMPAQARGTPAADRLAPSCLRLECSAPFEVCLWAHLTSHMPPGPVRASAFGAFELRKRSSRMQGVWAHLASQMQQVP